MQMGNRLKLLGLFLLAAVMLMSCEWLLPLLSELAEGESEPYTTYEVYTAGYFHDGTRNIACYWKDDERFALEEEVESEAFDIAVNSLGSVYVAGYYNEGGGDVPCVWYSEQRYPVEDFVGRATSLALGPDGYAVVGTLQAGESTGAFFATDRDWTDTVSPDARGTAVAESDGEFVYLWEQTADGSDTSVVKFHGGDIARDDIVLSSSEEYRDVAIDGGNCYVVGAEGEIDDDGVMYRRSMLWTIGETDHIQSTIIREAAAPEPQIAVYTTAVSVNITDGEVTVNGYSEDGFRDYKEDSYLWRDGSRTIVSALDQRRHVTDHAIGGSLSWLCGGYDPDYGAQRAWYAYREGFGFTFVDLSQEVESEARAMVLRSVLVYPDEEE